MRFASTRLSRLAVVVTLPLLLGALGSGAARAAGGVVDSPDCPVGEAMVNAPDGFMLNVRQSPDSSDPSNIIAQLPTGSEVTVTGGALKPAVGFAKTLKPKGGGINPGAGGMNPGAGNGGGGMMGVPMSGWCRIEAPARGFVSTQFLSFGGGAPLQPAVGFSKKKKAKGIQLQFNIGG